MADLGWIEVVGWDEYQHADVTRTAGPAPWIKNYTRLLHDPAYLELTAGERALLHGVWLEFASSRGKVHASPTWLTRRLNMKVTRRQLESLNQAGFIRFSASNVQAERKQDASSSRVGEDKRREEKKKPAEQSGSKTTGEPHSSPAPQADIESDNNHEVEHDWDRFEQLEGDADGYGPQPLDPAGELRRLQREWKSA